MNYNLYFNTLLKALLIAASLATYFELNSQANAAEILVGDSKIELQTVIEFQTVKELKENCERILLHYDGKIKGYEDAAKKPYSLSKKMAERNAKLFAVKRDELRRFRICSSCYGLMQIQCYKCKGSGPRDCGVCRVTGRYKCPDCALEKTITIEELLRFKVINR